MQPAEPGAFAEDVMLEGNPRVGSGSRGKRAGQGLEAGRWALGRLAPGAREQASVAEDGSEGMGGPLMRLFPGALGVPRAK